MNLEVVKEFILTKLSKDLSPDLYYHSLEHTIDVFNSATRIATSEKINGNDLLILQTACLFHDSGFLEIYKGHEEKSCIIVKEVLPSYNYEDKHIDQVCNLILATQIPQSPKNFLAEIICDADLDYLGRDDFEPIADKLFQELIAHNFITDIKQWNRIQVSFLGNHKYYTKTAINTREPKKQIQLKKLKRIVAQYDE